jgi:hypothetical protein
VAASATYPAAVILAACGAAWAWSASRVPRIASAVLLLCAVGGGVRIPMIRMPVAPGRNVAILVEVAARNQLLRSRGHHAARRLVDRLNQRLETARGVEAEADHGEDL